MAGSLENSMVRDTRMPLWLPCESRFSPIARLMVFDRDASFDLFRRFPVGKIHKVDRNPAGQIKLRKVDALVHRVS